jgi:subtilisin family serine protease
MQSRVILLCVMLSSLASGVFAGSSPVKRAEKSRPDEYIVVLVQDKAPDVDTIASKLAAKHHARVIITFERYIRAFGAEMTPAAAEAMAADPEVEWVEENAVVELAASRAIETTTPAVGFPTRWGLDHLDRASTSVPRTDGVYNYCTTGSGVRAYVLDTGILPQHSEFGPGTSRVDPAPSFLSYLTSHGLNQLYNQCWIDGDFTSNAAHGTAVASIIGGATFGVAPGVTLVDARVVPCQPSDPAPAVLRFIAFFEWVASDPNWHGEPRVVNISSSIPFTYDPSNALNVTINNFVNATQVPVVVAAGNFAASTFFYTPASASRSFCAAGLNASSDTAWASTNFGNGDIIYAPAQFVEAASTTAQALFPSQANVPRSQLPDCYNPMNYTGEGCTSGTSFSAPHVTGVVARYLQTHTGTRDQVWAYLLAQSAAHAGNLYEPHTGYKPILSMVDCQ